MDINFPLILVIAVFTTGAIWLFDWLFLSRKRNEKIQAVEKQFSHVSEPSESSSEDSSSDQKQRNAFEKAKSVAAQEPLLVEYAKSFFPVLAIVLVLRSFILEPFQIPSESMVPTLEVGDFILVNKFTYGIRLPVIRTKVIDVNDPERGDVMVFFPPNEDRYFIKRVIGLPGDKISYVNNVLTVNGAEMMQEFVRSEGAGSRREHCARANSSYHVVNETLGDRVHQMRKCVVPGDLSRDDNYIVPEGHYFMMGDNRDNSSDSRVWGAVPEERIVGKAFAIWMHWEEMLSLPSFGRVGSIQ
ncbi:MAG: signal peptidase I [Cellvibrionaceae bacterium]